MPGSTKESVTYFHNRSRCLKNKHAFEIEKYHPLGFEPTTSQGVAVGAGSATDHATDGLAISTQRLGLHIH